MRRLVVALSICSGFLLLSPLFPQPPGTTAEAAGPVSPIFKVGIPEGYRGWALVAPSHRTDNKDELRSILANPVAYKALRKGTLPLPDGSILAKLAWVREPMGEFPGAYRPGASPRLEFMVKNSKKYASTGGWGFGRFVDGKPASEETHKTCFPCHESNVKDHDFVFTRFAP